MRKHRGYWNENTIKEHAKECSSWEEFKGRYSQGYKLGMKLGIIHDIFKLSRKPNNYWTEELVIKEASKYKNRNEFKKNCSSAFNVAYDLKILSELFPSKKLPNGYWDEKNIRIESSKYKTKSEFQKKCGTAYNKAKKLGIIDDLGFELVGSISKRCIYAIEFTDNSVYIGLTYKFEKRIYDHFNDYSRKSSAREYLKLNFNTEYTSKQLTDYLYKEESSVLEKEYISYYKKNNWKIINKAKGGGLGGNYSKWSKDKVLETALNYDNPNEFKYSKDGSGYCYAVRHKFTNELNYNGNNLRKIRIFWNEELCLKTFLKYKNYKELIKSNDSGAYNYASRNNLLNKIKYAN